MQLIDFYMCIYVQKAIEMGIAIVKPEWVSAVWQNRNENVSVNDLAMKYFVLPFHKLTVLVSAVTKIEKEEIERLVTGG